METHCWLDWTVALYSINGKGDYRQFVANRVRKIQEHNQAIWHHVPTARNLADVGSRGGGVATNQLWREGPTWLRNRSEWPTDVTLEAITETRAEAKVKQEILAVASVEKGEFDQLLNKFNLFKVLCLGAWKQRFIANARTKTEERKSGPVDTEEIKQVKLWWIKRAQLQSICKFVKWNRDFCCWPEPCGLWIPKKKR